jgi:hypothetical protein
MTRLPRWRAGAALIAAVLLASCGHPEAVVVDKYFGAVNAKDKQTLGSFALVDFDQKVDKWKIKGSTSEANVKAPLSDLLAAQKKAEGDIAANRKEYMAYNLEHLKEVDEFKEIRKSGGKIPAKLADTGADWEKFEQKEKELKKQLGEAKRAVEREKKNMMVSVGNLDTVEGLEGEVLTKHLDVDLTIGGQPQPYKMTLKKYDVKSSAGAKVISRWVVTGLAKQ